MHGNTDKHTQFQSTFMRKKNTFQRYGSRRGASLLIALGITTIITLMAIGIATVVVSSLRDSSNLARSNEAYYAAEGALEAGLMDNATKGAGYSTNGAQPAYFGAFQQCGNDQACLAKTPKYETKGQIPEDKKYSGGNYGIPTPGTGTVGNNCNPLKAQISGTQYFNEKDGKYYPSQNNDPNNQYTLVDPEENPCNWNKIKYGESVSIPLYVTADQQYLTEQGVSCAQDPSNLNSYICNPKDLGLTSLIIRVRTPCESGQEMCLSGKIDRYTLDNTHGDIINVGGDDAILDWQIQAADKGGGKSYVMVPNHSYNLAFKKYNLPDSEIYESRINSYPSNQLEINQNNGTWGVDISPGGKNQGTIFNFLTDLTPWNLDGGIIRTVPTDAINKPVLKLTVINKLVDFIGGGSIPNLEYQILINTTKISPADSSQTVTAEAFSGGFKQVLESKTAQQGNQIQYVIQQ